MVRKLNTLFFGIASGIILPLILFFTLYYSKFSSIGYIEYPMKMVIGELLPVIFSWCILPDLLLFFIFNWADWLKPAKGVLISSVALTAALFALKLFFSWL